MTNVTIWLKLPPELAELIKKAAKADRRSVNSWATIQLEKPLRDKNGQEEPK